MVLLALTAAGWGAAAGVGEAVAVAGLADDGCAKTLADKPAMSIPNPKPRTALRTFTFIP
jgi:hypothetical protein